MNKPTFIFSITFFLLSQFAAAQYKRDEVDVIMDIRNRITVNHDDGGTEVFMITDRPIKVTTTHLYTWYRAQMIGHTQGGYTGKLLHGNYSSFYPSKYLKEEGNFQVGLKNGLWKYWRENATLVREETWKGGEMTGAARYYDERGLLIEQGRKRKGEWNGEIRRLVLDDSVYRSFYYLDGQQVSLDEYLGSGLMRRVSYFFERCWFSVFGR